MGFPQVSALEVEEEDSVMDKVLYDALQAIATSEPELARLIYQSKRLQMEAMWDEFEPRPECVGCELETEEGVIPCDTCDIAKTLAVRSYKAPFPLKGEGVPEEVVK
jgi:hypothetical protein